MEVVVEAITGLLLLVFLVLWYFIGIISLRAAFYYIGRSILIILTFGIYKHSREPHDLDFDNVNPAVTVITLLGFFTSFGLILFLFALVNN
jgi:hypothetical protein